MDSTPLYQKMTASGSSTPPLSSPMMSPDALKRRSDNNAGDATVKAFIADDDDAIDADFHRKSVIFEHPFDGSPLINFEKNELENTRADLTAAIITSSDEETKDTLHRKDDEPMEDHVDRPYCK